MPVICGEFGGNLSFTGNLQEVSGLLYPTSTQKSLKYCFKLIQLPKGLSFSSYSSSSPKGLLLRAAVVLLVANGLLSSKSSSPSVPKGLLLAAGDANGFGS